MKRIKILLGLLVALLVLCGGSVPTVSAQALDDVWLRCTINASAYVVYSGTGKYIKKNRTTPVYLHFTWNAVNSNYDITVWTRLNPDKIWVNWFNTNADTNHPGENFISNLFLKFWVMDTEYIETYHTPFIKIDKKGNVTYQGVGEISFGEFEGGNFYGYFNIKGARANPAKLPFAP
jgi:hypothetical protein